MNPATLARIVSKWGIKQMDLLMTPQRLRNTFGAGLIERGFSLPEIEEIMGYAPGAASAWRLHVASNDSSGRSRRLDGHPALRDRRR